MLSQSGGRACQQGPAFAQRLRVRKQAGNAFGCAGAPDQCLDEVTKATPKLAAAATAVGIWTLLLVSRLPRRARGCIGRDVSRLDLQPVRAAARLLQQLGLGCEH
jgi:hypothetical protein